MPRKRFGAEQIVTKLRQIEVFRGVQANRNNGRESGSSSHSSRLTAGAADLPNRGVAQRVAPTSLDCA